MYGRLYIGSNTATATTKVTVVVQVAMYLRRLTAFGTG